MQLADLIRSFDHNRHKDNYYQRFVKTIVHFPLGPFNAKYLQGAVLEKGFLKTIYILGEELSRTSDVIVRRSLFLVFDNFQVGLSKQLLHVYFSNTPVEYRKAQNVYLDFYKRDKGLTPPPLKIRDDGKQSEWLFAMYSSNLNALLACSAKIKAQAILSLCKSVQYLHSKSFAHGCISLETAYVLDEKIYLAMENGYIRFADKVDFENDVVRICRIIETFFDKETSLENSLDEKVLQAASVTLGSDRDLNSLIQRVIPLTEERSSVSPDFSLSSSVGESISAQKVQP
jgi:hypothetical protein